MAVKPKRIHYLGHPASSRAYCGIVAWKTSIAVLSMRHERVTCKRCLARMLKPLEGRK